MEINYCELTKMDVVNVVDGKNLGKTVDMVLSVDGKVRGIVVMGDKRLIKVVSKDTSLFVPWCNICKIGEDVVLVKLGENSNFSENNN